MTIFIPIAGTVRKAYRHEMSIDDCWVILTENSASVSGNSKTQCEEIAAGLMRWLNDGMLEGSPRGTMKRYP